MSSNPASTEVSVVDAEGRHLGEVVEATRHTLIVKLEVAPPEAAVLGPCSLRRKESTLPLGPCRFYPHPKHPLRRVDDPPPPSGSGRLVPLEEIYDFRSLLRKGSVTTLQQRLDQLPLVWNRKSQIQPAFRQFVGELLYDLQVYRSAFDEIDRNLASEPAEVAENIRSLLLRERYGGFDQLFNQGLSRLEEFAADMSTADNEVHGFYFRKHVWDLILSSEFLARTNLKPRGYAGDSEMMRMLYEQEARGPTVFSRFLHRHPIASAAAQAVRNRVGLLATLMHEAQERSGGRPLRVFSVACGPVRELRDVLATPDDLERFTFTLLDQDRHALGDARAELQGIERRLGAMPAVTMLQESVRTMLRAPKLADLWGQYDFVYTMGLFDYLTTPVAREVLKRLFALLLPGGELVVGNFHVGNPTRVYMDYWMDWSLFYRTEEELSALADGLDAASAEISFEDTRSQMFLRLRKKL